MPDPVAEAKRLLAEGTPGPWRWRGNVDYQDPVLVGAGPMGGTDVFSSIPVDRQPDDPRIHGLDDDYEPERADSIRQDFLFDSHSGIPRTDLRMAFTIDGRKQEARKLVVFEVARNATDRHDPKVYRADIVDIRHPDAQLIAAAPSLIAQLVEAVEHLEAKDRLAKIVMEEIDGIATDSEGITGWHMNGDLLMWGQVECLTALAEWLELDRVPQAAENGARIVLKEGRK